MHERMGNGVVHRSPSLIHPTETVPPLRFSVALLHPATSLPLQTFFACAATNREMSELMNQILTPVLQFVQMLKFEEIMRL